MTAELIAAEPSAVLVTGIQAAGKSTVGPLLARRFARGAFVEGDLMWKLIVSGRADMTPSYPPEAIRQLHLRYENGARLVDGLVRAGFTAVHVDILLGDDLPRYADWVSVRPLRVVVLCPDTPSVVARETGRGSTSYRDWMAGGRSLREAVDEFQTWVRDTPRLGLWVDSSGQTAEQTVDEILRRWDEALVLEGGGRAA